MAGKLVQAAGVRPPVGATETAVSTTASSALATSCVSADQWITLISDVAFNVEFGTSAVGAPSTNYMFAAGTPYSFQLAPEITSFRLRGTAAGTVKWWRSSYA